MSISYSTYLCNRTFSPASQALDTLLVTEHPDESYSQMMRFRLSGAASVECRDTYFIATDGIRCVSRLWHGWGLHPDAIGNFGNFRTDEDYRNLGIGRRLLQMWQNDLQAAAPLPLALFCTAAENMVPVYAKFGFRPALDGATCGPLYCPVANAPDRFRDFCSTYYSQTGSLHFLPGTIGFRHEIDLLLNFAMKNDGLSHALEAFPTYEAAFLALQKTPALGRLERIAIDNGHTVGWAVTPAGAPRQIAIHPNYISKLHL